MRTATSLAAPEPFGIAEDALPAQLPLPLPGTSSVIPVPQTRDGDALARQLRAPVARFMQALAEVLCGSRPARQLSAWMNPCTHTDLVTRLAQEARSPRRGPIRGRIASVHLCVVDSGAVEVFGRMLHGDRSRAIAVRLELVTTPQGHQVWTCTALTWA